MTRDRLIRILLRLGIVFVALQIAAFLVAFGIVVFVGLGGEMPMSGGSDFTWSHTELHR